MINTSPSLTIIRFEFAIFYFGPMEMANLAPNIFSAVLKGKGLGDDRQKYND